MKDDTSPQGAIAGQSTPVSLTHTVPWSSFVNIEGVVAAIRSGTTEFGAADLVNLDVCEFIADMISAWIGDFVESELNPLAAPHRIDDLSRQARDDAEPQ